MSTAGKVLTVLILLVMLVWVVMLSAVSQLNANHSEKILTQQKSLDKLVEDVETSTNGFHNLVELTRQEQEASDRDVRVSSGKLLGIERRKSSVTEDLTRLKFQLADYLAAVEKSKINLANREAEKAKDEDDLAKKKDEIAKAQALNSELRTQLAQLQDQFKRLLNENTSAIAKAKGQSEPVAKPASSRREAPAS